MTRKKLVDERFNEMVRLRESGKTIIEIASHYGISKQIVSEIFNKKGKPLRISLKNSDIERLKDPELIAKTYNLSVMHVKTRMRLLGIAYPKKHGYRTAKWTFDKVAALYEEYKGGLSQQQIAKKYKTSQSRISSLFVKYGFKTNKNGWPEGRPRKYF